MSDTLAVILGAGASFDCVEEGITDYDDQYKPPLVGELFAFRRSFNAILRKYPNAEALSDEIRKKVGSGTSLEAILRQLSSEENFAIRKQYWEIPLYLQELLGEVSSHFVRFGGTKFDTLVREIERSTVKETLFLTVNYDLFLDNALHRLYGITFHHIDSYCPPRSRWSLVKLHGSVNWGRELLNTDSPGGDSVQLLNLVKDEIKLEENIKVLGGYQENSRFIENKFFYPSLAVPIEGKDEFACPKEHVQKASSFFKSCRNFLIIGFSALDEHVLTKLKGVPAVRKLTVVNGRPEWAMDAIERIAAKNPEFSHERHPDCLYEGGFREFVASGALERFLGS